MVITIDGPAGSGKSTAARGLASALGIAYLDTGATYRAVTWKALRGRIDLTDGAAVAEAARRAAIRLVAAGEGLRVLLDGEDVTDEIRTAEVSDNSHYVASCPGARDVLVALQRRIGAGLGSFVSEGRDQGTVVFPDADVKFFLDADARVRAGRRAAELAGGGEPVDREQVLQAIRLRDERDSTRAVAPLVRPEGAIVIDTTGMSVEQVVAALLGHVESLR